MRFFASVLGQTLVSRLGNVKNWIILLLIPGLAAAAVWSIPAGEAASPVQVGVCLPGDGAPALWALLESRNDDLLTFVAADADTIDRNIAAGRWDCGILVAEDFMERIRTLDTDRIITLRTGPGSTVYPLVREAVSAALAQLAAPEIARDYLLDSGIADEAALADRFAAALDESDRVLVRLSTPDGGGLEALELARAGVDGLLCWMVSALLLVRLLLGAADLGRWIRTPAVGRLGALRHRGGMLTARALADGALLAFSGGAAMAVLGAGAWGCAAAAGYVLFWSAASVLLARFPAVCRGLPVCVSFAAVMSLLASSVLADPGLLLPGLGGVCPWLPVGLFMRTCRGDPAAALLLPGAALVCLILAAALPDRK